MNELLNDTKAVLLFLIGAIMTLFAWIGRRHLKEFDEWKEKSVTRDELLRTLAQMSEDRLQRDRLHDENREEFRYIRERLDGIADRQ